MIMWGAVADRDYLKYGPAGVSVVGAGAAAFSAEAVARPCLWCSEIAWPLGASDANRHHHRFAVSGVAVPYIGTENLNAIAADGTVPFLNVAGKLNDKGEPAIALAMTTGLCLVASMIGSLDLVAPLLSICFLSAYAALNFLPLSSV